VKNSPEDLLFFSLQALNQPLALFSFPPTILFTSFLFCLPFFQLEGPFDLALPVVDKTSVFFFARTTFPVTPFFFFF